jgi:simple sugar transport system permease protein
VVSLNLSLTGFAGIAVAVVIAIPLAAAAGFAYGLILNRVKGSEMMVGNYLAFSVVSLFSIIWMVFPVSNPSIVWPMTGRGVRTTITLTGSYSGTLDKFLAFEVVPGLVFPTGLFLVFALGCTLVYFFSKSRTGMSMLFSGMNPGFGATIGINEDKMRVLGNILSSVLASIGIVVYAQSYGFYQLYSAPLMMAFPSIAAILIGGATPRKATIVHVIIGTVIYQSLLTIAMPVANKLVSSGGLSEIARVLVSNGIILYALTKINSERQNGK